MKFGPSAWQTYDAGIRREWLLTNGIGGYASSTVIGANVRRYHGLLIAALPDHADRFLMLSQISEAIVRTGEIANLMSYCTKDICSNGEYFLESFSTVPLPTWTYRIGPILLEKRVCLCYGQNATVIRYHVENGPEPVSVNLTPLINHRNHHFLTYNQYVTFEAEYRQREIICHPYRSEDTIRIRASDGILRPHDRCWFYNMDYAIERERGLTSSEDHFMPGHFEIALKPWEKKTIHIIVTANCQTDTQNGEVLIGRELSRQQHLLGSSLKKDPFLSGLLLAADQFVIRGQDGKKAILAGYPWLNAWGRDTLISLPGLLLSTGRVKDSAEILTSIVAQLHDGLIYRSDAYDGSSPDDASADAPLWLFEAAYRHFRRTRDAAFIRHVMLPAFESIISAWRAGTKYGIHVDEDGLVQLDDRSQALTWMHTKAGNWVVTPRSGKAVEINALWYNALKIMAFFGHHLRLKSGPWVKEASRVRESFMKTFWMPDSGYFADVVDEGRQDTRLRPNQVLAMSLSFPVVGGDKARSALDHVFEELYTRYGLRTLSKKDPEYRDTCTGDPYAREGAMHQGAVWPWLIGPFVTAWCRSHARDPNLASFIEMIFLPFRDHLNDACLNGISQVFDGSGPHLPRGGSTQAWNIGEVLRAYVEYCVPLTGFRNKLRKDANDDAFH